MHVLYSVALVIYFLTLLPAVVYRRVRHGRAVGRVRDRLGRLPELINRDHRRSVWIHAVSVGEVLTARSLLRDIRLAYPAHRVFMSTTTSTGQQVARQLGDAVDGVFYAPLDLVPFVTRALVAGISGISRASPVVESVEDGFGIPASLASLETAA